ncbi:MAG: 2-iminoacetate synthase ThiH [Rheinheimera sp.]|nr:MAG: 2-iminoacetate synthase ThiH [Rheinheimera sp.]
MQLNPVFPVNQSLFDQLQQQSCLPDRSAVQQALSAAKPDFADLQALLSPAAAEFLPQMLARATQLKRQRSGRTLALFAPLYLSNLCSNECSYCGFSRSVAMKRRILTIAEAQQEAAAIQALGIGQILLVTGEHQRKAGVDYLLEVTQTLRPQVAKLLLESQPLGIADYQQLRTAGIDAVMLYQETYDPQSYTRHHTFGAKADMAYRLDAPARVAAAGIAQLGMGVLLGLSDWRTDVLLLAQHLRFLQQHWYQLAFTVALPRLKPCAGQISQHSGVSDRDYLQLLCALKIFAPELSLSISTRDSPALRDLLLTSIACTASAGSKTQPGGYAVAPESLAQFSIDDERSPAEIAAMLRRSGIAPVWQDWHPLLGRRAV